MILRYFYRKSENRLECSRYAARDRRDDESNIFDNLKLVVPIVDESIIRVERNALLRTAVTHCRLRQCANICK